MKSSRSSNPATGARSASIEHLDASRPRDPVRVIQQGLIGLVLAGATLAFYSGAIRGGFVWDDNNYVTANPTIPASDGLLKIWTPGVTSQYYPITYTTFWLEYRLYGQRFWAMGFHLVNVCLHVVNALLLVLVLKRLRIPFAWLAGFVFALHPVHVESVAWIAERKNVLSGVFYLLSILMYLRFMDRRGVGSFVGSLALYAAALLSKTATCALPVALFLMHWYRERRFSIRHLLGLIPFFVVGIGLAGATVYVERTRVGASADMFDLVFPDRVIIACRALLFYAWKLLVPYPVIFNYARWEIDAANLADWWPVPIVLLLAMGGGYLIRRKQPVPAIVAVYFLASLFPVLGLLNYFYMKYSFVADHFQYFASMAVIPFVIVLADRVLRRIVSAETLRKTIGCALSGLVLLIFGGITFVQAGHYENQETLWRATIAANDRAYLAYNNLGSLLLGQRRYAEAETYLRYLLEHDPNNTDGMTNLGVLLGRLGRHKEGERWLRKAIQVTPTTPHYHFNLGTNLTEQGRFAEAVDVFREEIRVNPIHAGAYASLGMCLARLGNVDEGIKQLRLAIERLPDFAVFHYNVGLLLGMRKRYAEAAASFQRAVELDPRNPQYRQKLQAAQTLLHAPQSGVPKKR